MLSLLYGPALTSVHDYWKTVALTIQNFVGKVMSLLFNVMSRLCNILSRFVVAFLARSKYLLISWLQHRPQWFWSPRKKSVIVSTFPPSICLEVMGLDAMILIFWMLSFKPAFSLSSFTLIRGSLVPLHFLPIELWKCYSLSSVWLFVTPRTVAHQALKSK